MNIFNDLNKFILETLVILALLAFLLSLVYLLIKKLIGKLTFKVNYSNYDINPLNKQQKDKQHYKGIKTNYDKKTIDLSGVSKIDRDKKQGVERYGKKEYFCYCKRKYY